jgi:ABC-type branched-subunit amino acid transport system permease subunit
MSEPATPAVSRNGRRNGAGANLLDRLSGGRISAMPSRQRTMAGAVLTLLAVMLIIAGYFFVELRLGDFPVVALVGGLLAVVGASMLSLEHRSMAIIGSMAAFAALMPLVVLLPPFSGFQTQLNWIDTFSTAGVFILLALGLNIVVGLAGLLDLGYAAFFAIGSYTYAFAASPFTGLDIPFWVMLFVGLAVAALFGILLGAPTLRLRGDYLAIVTLGFGEIVPIVFRNSSRVTGGPNGIGGIYKPEVLDFTFGFLNQWPFFITVVVLVTIVFIFSYRLQESRLGRAWMAVREDELAAASSGVNTVTTKLLAFALGACTAGFGGVFYASKLTNVSPDQFSFNVSFTILAMVVLGGMGNMWGVAIGAFIIFSIQSVLLKQMNTFVQGLGLPVIDVPILGPIDLGHIDFLEFQFLLYGLALVLLMLLRPEGIFPSQRRKRELHSAEDDGLEISSVADPMGSTPQ